jgi:hypothetical protein
MSKQFNFSDESLALLIDAVARVKQEADALDDLAETGLRERITELLEYLEA